MFAKTLGINRFAKHYVLITIDPLTCDLGSKILGRRRPSTTTFFWRISRGFWYYRNKENMFYRPDFTLSFKDFVVYDRFTLAILRFFFFFLLLLLLEIFWSFPWRFSDIWYYRNEDNTFHRSDFPFGLTIGWITFNFGWSFYQFFKYFFLDQISRCFHIGTTRVLETIYA